MKYKTFLEKTSLNQEEVLSLAWGNLVEDPPEKFISLPRPPMLMIDRVELIEHDGPRGRIIAERDVRVDDWFFQCHFGGDPVQPGCLGVDAIWQLIGLYCGLRGGTGSGRALGCKEVEFSGQIRPHDLVVRYDVTIRRYTQLKGGGTSVAIGTGRVLVDGEHIYTIKDAKVGLFDGIAYPDYPRRSENSTGGIMER
jgi:3-hydroxyacyl-[acyl-carrier protein] dehydratase/trans-2-decenoyl-[acyl-carrier protein] isomerase